MTLRCAHGPCAGQQLGLAAFLLHSSHCLRGSQTLLTPPLRRPWVLPAHAAQVLVVLLVNPMPGSTPQVSEVAPSRRSAPPHGFCMFRSPFLACCLVTKCFFVKSLSLLWMCHSCPFCKRRGDELVGLGIIYFRSITFKSGVINFCEFARPINA